MPTDLTPESVEAFLSDHPEWRQDGDSIFRTFVFADFSEAMGFVTRVSLAAEVADHHPDIDIRWNKVTLLLTTHDQAALTTKDIDLAEQFDTFAEA